MKTLLIFILTIIVCGCSLNSPNEERIQAELDLKTDSTITINVMDFRCKNFPVSELLDSVRYIALENSDEALIAIVRKIKVTKNLIYVLDLQNDRLKCFDRTGKFIRKACSIGGGPEEIGHLVDFDVDENYLYVLDGAKIAIHVFDHNGKYVEKKALPFHAQQFKIIPDKGYLFELSPFGIDNNKNPTLVVLTDLHFRVIKELLQYIDGAFVGVSFENRLNSTYLNTNCGNGIYEKRDSSIFMKYYLDFDGKYFNANKRVDGYKQAVDQEIYFTSNAPIHNSNYLIQVYYAGMQRTGILLIRLKDNRTLFIENLIQDRSDVLNFSFAQAMGYDEMTGEFFGICNYLDISDVFSDDKIKVINDIKSHMPKEVQPFLLQDNTEKNMNQIIMFYKLKPNITF